MSDNFKNSCPFPVQNELEIFFLQGCSCIADIAVTCRPARVCARAPFPGKGRVSPFDFDLSYEAQQENTLWLRLDGCPIGPRLTAGTHLNTILFFFLLLFFIHFSPNYASIEKYTVPREVIGDAWTYFSHIPDSAISSITGWLIITLSINFDFLDPDRRCTDVQTLSHNDRRFAIYR